MNRLPVHFRTSPEKLVANPTFEMPVPPHVINAYSLAIADAQFIGNSGGFSGAQFWKILDSENRSLCLRRWPREHPNQDQLEWIHKVLLHAKVNGLSFIPAPIRPVDQPGSTWVNHGGHLWELSAWMPGRADFEDNSTDARSTAAVKALARFHQSSAQVQLGFETSETIRNRVNLLYQSELNFDQLRSCSDFSYDDSLFRLHQLVLSPSIQKVAIAVADQLSVFEHLALPVQPVIRDIWHDHVLFTGDSVSGIVDFGAMRVDSICCDLSRLLGSLVGAESDRWEMLLDKYAEIRPLLSEERRIAGLLDRAGVILGALNWLDWLLIQKCEFSSKSNVIKRLDLFSNRLGELLV